MLDNGTPFSSALYTEHQTELGAAELQPTELPIGPESGRSPVSEGEPDAKPSSAKLMRLSESLSLSADDCKNA
eukprot:2196012-Rhodomonas_salina.1